MNLDEVLDMARERTGSDYRTAQHLGVYDSTIANWRNRPGSAPDDELLPELAKLAGLPLPMVTAIAYRKRTKSAEMRRMWDHILRRFTRGE